MKKHSKQIVSVLAVLCLAISLVAPLSGITAAEDLPPLGVSAFETETSYLSYDQYIGLGFNLGAASAVDRNQSRKPLETYETQGYTFEEVKYGWSNPQIIAVMLSSPYWDELDYGADMSAAGSTSFLVSTGVEASSTKAVNIGLGLSFSASASAEVFGNGGEVGFELQSMLEKATEVQTAKTQEKTLEFQAGAGDDHVALAVFPVASYKYSYKNSSGETEYIYVNMQLEPVHTVATLSAYNKVAREFNMDQEYEERMLPIVDMYYISSQYKAGDPSTYCEKEEDFPHCLLFENGKLIAYPEDASLADDQLTGEMYVADTAYNVALGKADTGAAMSLTLSEAEGQSLQMSVALGASVYGEISEGVDIGVAEFSASQRLTLSAAYGVAVSRATLNTKSITYSIGFIDLPASAQTGTTGTGIPKSDYAFNGRLAVWSPKTRGQNVTVAPTIITALVEFADPDAKPLYLPDDIHVDGVSDTTAVLAWSNPDFGVFPYNQRHPAKYEIAMLASGSGGDVYTTVATIESSDESFAITGLSPNTTYTYALRASDGNGRYSAYSPPVSVTTAISDPPVLLRYPVDTTVSLGEQPLFYVEAEATSPNYTLSYHWYVLEAARYGNVWTKVYAADDPVFNAAYFEKDGIVDAANRYALNGNLYRCVVVENRGDTSVSLASPAARLTIDDVFYIRNYNELREVALSIRGGHKEVANYDYILTRDITCPSDEPWNVPIGSSSIPFSGTFDGQGHTISGLTADVTSVSPFGLFGAVKGGTVKNLHLKDVRFASDDAHTGAICGTADNALISGCTVSGSVAGSAGEGGSSAGGICGWTSSSTVVEKCMNYSSVSGQLDAVGGVVGYNQGMIRNCANHGALKAYCPYFDHMPTMGYVGGVAGRNYGTVEHCYNVGSYTIDNPQISWKADICNGNKAVNSYYVNSFDNGEYGGRTASQFADGTVAYALNGGVADGTQAWYQSIDNGHTPDAYPHLTAGADMTVYRLETGTYSNSPSSDSNRPPAGIGHPTVPTTETTKASEMVAKSTTTKSATTKSTTTAKTPDAPKTGDSTQAWLWSVLAVAAATVVMLSARRTAKTE